MLVMYIFLLILLGLATISDLVRHKIPNAVSLGGIVAGFICQGWFYGTTGILDGVLGMLVGLGLFLPFYILKAMAAGDVKLMAMVGTFVGPKVVLVCVAGTLVLGMVLALVYVMIRGKNSKDLLRRYGLMIKTFLSTFKWVYIPPENGEAGAMKFSYALAINAGAVLALWYFNIAILNVGS